MTYNSNLDDSVNSEIRACRIALGNPYAFLNSEGFFDSKLEPHKALSFDLHSNLPRKKQRYSEVEIEKIVRKIHTAIWKNHRESVGEDKELDPTILLEPKRIITALGYSIEERDSLGEFTIDNRQVKVAGHIDNSEKCVYSSTEIPLDRRLFCITHELGHLVLHEGLRFHREVPIDGTKQRTGTEWEADKFATYFLMPTKLLKDQFQRRFGCSQLTRTPEIAFLLDIDRVPGNKINSRRKLSRLVASTESYAGNSFISLAKQFNVSVETMAIRLEELNLVDFEVY
tara:strand:- start:283 stop:1137 length:855 start_codon:yes stop_codon:yes gene_type:complete